MTTLRYLLDTNILSEPIRPKPNSNVIARLEQAKGTVVIASLVWQEISFGYHRLPPSNRRQILEAYLQEEVKFRIPILPYDTDAAGWFAQEKARLMSLGRMPADADGQIAGVAAVNNLILVTRNVSDYVHFAELTIENWFDKTI